MSSIVKSGSDLMASATTSLQSMRNEALKGAKEEDKAGINAKFDMLEFQAKNDAINLIIGTLSQMLKSNKEVADEVKRNI